MREPRGYTCDVPSTPADTDLNEPDPVIDDVGGGLHRVRLPLPAPAGHVNCWVGLGPDGATIVDTGIGGAQAERNWRSALELLELAPSDVACILITHFHPDHIGGAGPLAALTGAPVIASAVTVEQSPLTWGHGLPDQRASLAQALRRQGVPDELFERVAGEGSIRWKVDLPDHMDVAASDAEFEFAGARWRLVATPGHADGHVVLVDDAGRRMLAGDHLLERISPSIGLFPGHSTDPLGDYLESLERTATLDVDLVLPGHGEPFRDPAARVRELQQHHAERLDRCRGAVADTGAAGATTWQVARAVFPKVVDVQGQRFAVAETLAHLEYLRLRGRLQDATGSDGIARYIDGIG